MSFEESVSLPDGWQIMTVDQLVRSGALAKPLDGNHGGIHPKASDYVEHGIPFVMASDLQGGQVDLSNCKFISEVQANSLRKGFAQAGDVLLSHKATIGRTAIVQASEYPFLMLTPQVTYYRVLDAKKLVPNYLKAYFDSHFFQSILALWAGSGSTRAYLGITGQLKLPIIVPPIAFQKLVAVQAEALNDKIQLNHQINQTLEQMAQAIFKSWFVDFEPVKAKIAALEAGGSEEEALLAAMRAISGKGEAELTRLQAEQPEQYAELRATAELFPSAMQDSELGEIPEGWSISSIYEITDVIYGAPFKSKLFNQVGDGIPLIRIRDLKHERPGVSTPEEHPKGYLVQNGDLLVGMDGEFKPYIWGSGPAWMNQRVCCFKPKNCYSAALVKGFIEPQLRVLELTATATTVIHLGKGDINRFEFVNAGSALLDSFSKIADSFIKQIVTNKTSSNMLEQLRDTLLPKLLSGELSVSAAETQLAEAEEAANV